MPGLALLVALAGVLVAVVFFMQSRKARAEATALASDIGAARAEALAAQKALADQKGELRERRDEAAGLRLKLDEAKKKAFEQAETQKKLGGAQALREELEKVTTRLAEARAEAAHQVELARAAEAARARAVAEADKLKAALERRAAEPVAPPPPPPPPPDVAAAVAAAETLAATEKDRADKAEAKLAEARKKLLEVEKDLKGSRGRLETEKRVYMVAKGEVDLAHDRYAELKRRHDALRKEHDELIEAVRQAAREERRQSEKLVQAVQAEPVPAEAPPGEGTSGGEGSTP